MRLWQQFGCHDGGWCHLVRRCSVALCSSPIKHGGNGVVQKSGLLRSLDFLFLTIKFNGAYIYY